MEIKTWKCDICGRVTKDGECGFAEKKPINIEINKGLYDGISSFKYKDTCIDCRTDIADAIGSIIEFLKEN